MKLPSDLEKRVDARKRELIAELIENKLSVRFGAPEAVAYLRGRLSDLAWIANENRETTRVAALEDWIAR